MEDLQNFFELTATAVDREMASLIESAEIEPPRLLEAIKWSVFGGGKRFRPALMFAVGETYGVPTETLLRSASAVEMIHTYSLIHDDLPAMDDDDLRRGRETCHKKFDEATAILAGDALQVLAFKAVADDIDIEEAVRVRLVSGLAEAAVQMVAGQQLDLDSEGSSGGPKIVERIHRNKTGALISFSADAALIVGAVGEAERECILRYASLLGLMFQVSDDLLDVTETTETLGKTAAKDETSQKLTYPSVFGLVRTQEILADIYERATALLAAVDRDTARLRAITDFIVHRRY